MTNKQSVPRSKTERDLAMAAAQKIKETTFKLMVKIISWESGSLESLVIKSANKITPKEWLEYKKHQLNIDTSFNKERSKKGLVQTYDSIKANGGFE